MLPDFERVDWGRTTTYASPLDHETLSLPPSQRRSAMPDHEDGIEQNKAVVRRFVEEVQNQKNWDAFDELNAPDFVNLSAPPGIPNDFEGGKMFLGAFVNAFPDSHVTVDDMIAEGDCVVTKNTFVGTHTGEFMGIAPTGKRVELQYVDILRLRDGQIIEHWLSMNQLSFMQQLGVIPS
jgi:predicted ester cyclase